MAYDINKALERLEKNLCDVDSARKQVEKTVACSTDLQNIVNGYVASIIRKTKCSPNTKRNVSLRKTKCSFSDNLFYPQNSAKLFF